MKEVLKAQFELGNQWSLGRNQLIVLKHVGRVQDFIKKFSRIMLEIKDMSEEDQIYLFMNGLQPWV